MKYLVVFGLLGLVACSETNEELSLTQVTTLPLAFSSSAKFAENHLCVDEHIYKLNGDNLVSLGVVDNALNTGTYQGALWVCGANSNEFFVAKQNQTNWDAPSIFPLPAELDLPFDQYKFKCAVTSQGFMFEASYNTDDAPVLHDYIATSPDAELKAFETTVHWGQIGWNDSLTRVAKFEDGIGYQTADAAPVMLNSDSANSFAASAENGVIAYGLTAYDTTILLMNGTSIDRTVVLDREILVLDADRIGDQWAIFGVEDNQLSLIVGDSTFTFSDSPAELHVSGNYLYLALSTSDELHVFTMR